MNFKYFEHIVKHLPVISACLLVGALARLAFLDKGVDDYTANIIFWCVTALGIILYALIVLFLDGIIKNRKILPQKNSSKNSTKDDIPTENLENIKQEQQSIIDQNEQGKKDIAIKYTQNQFALYTSEDDLKSLCNYVVLYSEKNKLDNIKPIKIEKLSNLDLYHFGWNIWKHFNVRNQFETAVFLKNIFLESLKEVEPESIKRHLKDDEMKGIITIMESLSE
ncbi:hypothetical protein [Kaistella jeonii]|uniref:Mobilization protein n=1 Tax=Kaistella jeonii TaxID=266749 RepID=A0A0C1CYY6_9FLAO|nr:hypothetical protein [Kaistella jeonii]KIA89611.1 hypothetical protein OA86_02975 [Kaistella jeonii]SFB89964.1 hypothetical protein SAMN05421876_103305 [Kaistella jeonii]VEI95822.1 Uncharacterised protein [Kaistella jeonii]